VTGLGAITPLGADVASTWEVLLMRQSGIRGDALRGCAATCCIARSASGTTLRMSAPDGSRSALSPE
jgi:hypothetical protein